MSALIERFCHSVSNFKHLVFAVVAGPHYNLLIFSVSAGRYVNAEVLVAERIPVVVAFWLVIPLLRWVPFSNEKNKPCSSIVIASLNTNSIIFLDPVPDVTSLRIIVVDFVPGVLRLADSHLPLITSDVSGPEKNSATSHHGLDHEGFVRFKIGALEKRLLNLVVHLKFLVPAVVPGPHVDDLAICVSAGRNVNGETLV